MRTREEQIRDIEDFCSSLAISHDSPSSEIISGWLSEAEQRVRAEISKRHTWFYMVDDPESGHADIASVLCNSEPFEIVEMSEAADIRIFFAYQDEDGEIHEFSTRSEAEQAAREAIDAAREVG